MSHAVEQFLLDTFQYRPDILIPSLEEVEDPDWEEEDLDHEEDYLYEGWDYDDDDYDPYGEQDDEEWLDDEDD